jgi:hypothetical protein
MMVRKMTEETHFCCDMEHDPDDQAPRAEWRIDAMFYTLSLCDEHKQQLKEELS